MDYSESNISSNIASPSIAAPSSAGGRKGEMFLTDTEVQPQPVGVLSEASVMLDSTISKTLKEAYNNSFVSLPKPEISSSLPQQQLLKNAEAVKNVAQQMLDDTVEETQATVASEMLAANEVFLQATQQHYLRYLAAGGFDQEQTNQENPTIASELAQKQVEQEGIQNAFTTVKNIAMKALIFT